MQKSPLRLSFVDVIQEVFYPYISPLTFRMPLHRTFCVGIAFFIVHIRQQFLVASSYRIIAWIDLWPHVSRGVYLRRKSVARRDYHDHAKFDASKLQKFLDLVCHLSL